MSTPTETQPTDTIRDAFEAMLWFLACLIGPLRPRKITPAEEIGALAACEVETDFEPDEPPAPLLALRDLVQRAAEEHNRRAAAGGDFTPERHREARERCAAPGLSPAPWIVRDDCGGRGVDRGDRDNEGSDRFILNEGANGRYADLAFAAHAREDLPAALAWGEQQAREIEALRANLQSVLGSACRRAEELAAERDSKAAEIERLTAELAVSTAENASLMQSSLDEIGRLTTALEQRRAPADASLEARALTTIAAVTDIGVTLTGTPGAIARFWLAVVRAVDASRPAVSRLPAPDADTVSPAHLAAIEIVTWTDGSPEQTRHGADLIGMGPAAVAEAVARAYEEGMASQQRRDAKARPGLTEEQARAAVSALAGREMTTEEANGDFDGLSGRDLWDAGYDCALKEADAAILRASRGEPGPAADQVAPLPDSWRCEECKETFARCTCKHGDPEHSSNLGPGIGGAPIRVRPTAGRRASLEAALHDPETAEGAAAILADMPPDPLAPDHEDGTLCADCRAPRNTIHGALCSVRAGAKPGRVPDPRATLHAGDPAAVDVIAHARDMMRNANHHADAEGRSKITVDSEPFNALEEYFAPVFAAERAARRAKRPL